MDKRTSVQYEHLVHKLFSKELEKHVDLLDFKIYHNKQYLGKSGQQHQIDVGAEFNIAGVKVLILVECKLYTRNVGIDDVLVLKSRLDDIGAHKGILVTTTGFQSGAVKIAQSGGIALVRACDLGWFPCFEDPTAEVSRQQEFRKASEKFISWYLGQKAKRDDIDSAVERIATFDVASAFGVRPYPLGSLQYGQGRVQLPPSIRDVSAQHAFVVEGECSQIILDTRGLFALLAFG